MSQQKLAKMEALQQKINQLNAEKLKIEQQLSLELISVLKKTGAISINFDALIGGLLSVIKSIQANTKDSEVWLQAGQKFRGAKTKSKNAEPAMAE